jgi:hypothetical protein
LTLGWTAVKSVLNYPIYSNDFFFTEFVAPICLPARSEAGETFVGEVMTVSGWGRESDSSSGIARVRFFLIQKFDQFANSSFLVALCPIIHYKFFALVT